MTKTWTNNWRGTGSVPAAVPRTKRHPWKITTRQQQQEVYNQKWIHHQQQQQEVQRIQYHHQLWDELQITKKTPSPSHNKGAITHTITHTTTTGSLSTYPSTTCAGDDDSICDSNCNNNMEIENMSFLVHHKQDDRPWLIETKSNPSPRNHDCHCHHNHNRDAMHHQDEMGWIKFILDRLYKWGEVQQLHPVEDGHLLSFTS
jgi:hypothetical protein